MEHGARAGANFLSADGAPRRRALVVGERVLDEDTPVTASSTPHSIGSRLLDRPVAQKLREHFTKVAPLHLRQLFRDDPARWQRLSAEACGFYLDYSKNRVLDETLSLLLQLADE